MLIRKALLLGTSGCHLCDLAFGVVERFNELMKIHEFVLELERADIAVSKEMVDQYGVRIPVLIDGVTRKELDWPFDEQSLYEFLRACDHAV